MDFNAYQYVNGQVHALQLNVESQFTIAAKLVDTLLGDQLNHFLMSYPSGGKSMQLEWRYKDSAKTFILKENMYLVVMDNGRCMPMTSDEFETIYLNESVDPIIRPDETKTVTKAMVDFVNQFFPGTGMTEDKIDADMLGQMVNGLNAWYDKKSNVFDVKFTDCGITDPTGIVALLKACPRATFMDKDTTFTLNFTNGAFHEGDPNILPNYFNVIALNKLIGELRKLDTVTVSKIRGIAFQSVKEGSPSAITPSVSPAFWQSFQLTFSQVTGTNSPSAITR